MAAAGRGPDRHGDRPLLRDGPRPALGSRPAGLRPARPRPRRARAPTAARRRAATPTSATRPTSSSPPTRGRRRGAGSAPATRCSRFNFRPDRMREITRALADPAFAEIDRGGAEPVAALRDDDRVRGGVAVPGRLPAASGPETTLSAVIAAARRAPAARRRDREVPARHVLLQRRRGDPVRRASGASWSPSPRDVPTYDHKPEMSAPEAAAGVRRRLAGATATGTFGIINFANADMVGHTGVIPAAVEAIETVDRCLGEVVAAVHASRRRLSDHRRPRQRRPHARARRQPQHRPLAQPGAGDRHRARGLTLREGGVLADVAPTILALLGIEQPAEMTGRSLISPDAPRRPARCASHARSLRGSRRRSRGIERPDRVGARPRGATAAQIEQKLDMSTTKISYCASTAVHRNFSTEVLTWHLSAGSRFASWARSRTR